MKAGQRLGLAIGVAALALAATPTLAQTSPPPPEETPESGAIGPRELQNFSIDGTVTRRADPPPAQRPATAPPAVRAPATQGASPLTDARDPAESGERVAEAPAAAPSQPETQSSSAREPGPAPARGAAGQLSAPASSVTVPLPPLDGRVSDSDFASADDSSGLGLGFTAWPWLLAAIALALGGLFLWRSRSRHAFAGYADGPQVDAFVAPDPPPAQRPSPPAPLLQPAPPAAAPPSFGVVSTRLRPRLELVFKPLRCIVDDERVLVDFELELTNNGSAPARAVLVEASMFNAGPEQDQAIGAFFANPVAKGERIAAIEPLKRISVRSQVVAPRANVQLFKVEGREMLVPLIAFNALYGWSGGEAQSSSVYLLGRDTKHEKLAPLRADLGVRQFVDLGARLLPNEVRS